MPRAGSDGERSPLDEWGCGGGCSLLFVGFLLVALFASNQPWPDQLAGMLEALPEGFGWLLRASLVALAAALLARRRP